MKSRIAFLFVLAAFFNPISVMAVGQDSKDLGSKIGCTRSAEKRLEQTSNDLNSGAKKIEGGLIVNKAN